MVLKPVCSGAWALFKKKKIVYLFMIDREREVETQAEGEASSMPGARHGTRILGLQDHTLAQRQVLDR